MGKLCGKARRDQKRSKARWNLAHGIEVRRPLTDEEANEHTRDYIEQSVWAFNASFLAGQTGLPESAFEGLSKQCEEGNEPIMQMIQATCGIDSFVEAAISADGRGHFLARYDSEEREFNNGRMTFYIYRIN